MTTDERLKRTVRRQRHALSTVLFSLLLCSGTAYAGTSLCGDLNGDGAITTTDSLLHLNKTVGLSVDLECPEAIQCWDLNENELCDRLTEDSNGDGLCSVADCSESIGAVLPPRREPFSLYLPDQGLEKDESLLVYTVPPGRTLVVSSSSYLLRDQNRFRVVEKSVNLTPYGHPFREGSTVSVVQTCDPASCGARNIWISGYLHEGENLLWDRSANMVPGPRVHV
jgi:hypothetical protein